MVNQSYSSRGMTLLEVMLVIVIIGIVSTLAIPTFSRESAAQKGVAQLLAILHAAADTAIISNAEVGLQFVPDGYHFLRWEDEQTQWHEITDNTILRPRIWPSDLELALHMVGQRILIKSKTSSPQIVFYAMGNITPFELELIDHSNADRYRITATANGKIYRTN